MVTPYLRQIAKEHSREHNCETRFVPGWGWLCEKCDADFRDYDWPDNTEVFDVKN